MIDNEENFQQAFEYYKAIGYHENAKIRRNFIYNLPGVLIITQTTDFEEFHQIYTDIFYDTDDEVRLCLVSSIHEVVPFYKWF